VRFQLIIFVKSSSSGGTGHRQAFAVQFAMRTVFRPVILSGVESAQGFTQITRP